MITAIQEVSGLKMEQDVIELKQNTPDGKYMIKKLPGPAEGRRGHADPRPDGRQQLREVGRARRSSGRWARPARAGRSSSSTTRATRSSATSMTNGWPKSLEIGSLKAGDTERAHREADDHLRGDRRSRAADAADRSARSSARTTPTAETATCCARRSSSSCPRGYVDSAGTVHRSGHDAAGDGPRRARAARRRPGRGEPGLPHGRAARPRRRADRHGRPTSTRASSRTSSRRTWPSCRTSTAGSTRRATPGRRSTCPACGKEFTVDLTGGRLGES